MASTGCVDMDRRGASDSYGSGRQMLLLFVSAIALVIGLLIRAAIQAPSPARRNLAIVGLIVVLVVVAAFVSAVAWYFSHWKLTF
jgi:asparagine N-glycosylation enzyme membrane subunit Stt3